MVIGEDNVEVGPFCVVGPDVKVGAGTRLVAHVVLMGHTTLGKDNWVFPNATLGAPPQDRKYHGEPTRLEIGDNNQIREGVTMNPGTEGGGMKTTVGDRCFFLANSHVAHDTSIGDNVIFSNNVMCAGHVKVGNFVIVGGGPPSAEWPHSAQRSPQDQVGRT